MPIEVNVGTFPQVHRALYLIECDSGGHLVGRGYPGKPVDLNTFTFPDSYRDRIILAEAELTGLTNNNEFETFVCGETTEQEALARRYGLSTAHALLDAYFNGEAR